MTEFWLETFTGEDEEEDEDVDDDEDEDDDDDDENDVINQNEQTSNDQRNSGMFDSDSVNRARLCILMAISAFKIYFI